jgi:hypothetical protein
MPFHRLPGVTEDGMTYSNIVKVMQGYRRWNDIFQHCKGYAGLQKMEYSNITKVTRGYRRWNVMLEYAIPSSVTPGNLCNVGICHSIFCNPG